MKFKTEKSLHYFLMGLMGALIVLSVVFVYMGTQGKLDEVSVPEELLQAERAGQTKSLPDFIVDKVPANELETLKP